MRTYQGIHATTAKADRALAAALVSAPSCPKAEPTTLTAIENGLAEGHQWLPNQPRLVGSRP